MQIKAKLKVMEVTEMKMKNPMLVVTDIEKSVEFYFVFRCIQFAV